MFKDYYKIIGYLKYINPFYVFKFWKDETKSFFDKIKTSLPLIVLIFLTVLNGKAENSLRSDYNLKLKSLECNDDIWYTQGKSLVKQTFNIVSVSLDLDEGKYNFHRLPTVVEDIDCKWAKDFIYQQSGELRKRNIFISYPGNEEFVDCFCKGFVEESEKYILNKNN